MTPLDLSSGKDLGPTNVFYPSSLSEAVGLKDAQLKVKAILMVTFLTFILKKQISYRLKNMWKVIYKIIFKSNGKKRFIF